MRCVISSYWNICLPSDEGLTLERAYVSSESIFRWLVRLYRMISFDKTKFSRFRNYYVVTVISISKILYCFSGLSTNWPQVPLTCFFWCSNFFLRFQLRLSHSQVTRPVLMFYCALMSPLNRPLHQFGCRWKTSAANICVSGLSAHWQSRWAECYNFSWLIKQLLCQNYRILHVSLLTSWTPNFHVTSSFYGKHSSAGGSTNVISCILFLKIP